MTQRREIQRAIAHVRSLVVTVARRRPMGFTNIEADAALADLRIARIHLERVEKIYELRQGELRPEPRETQVSA